MNEINSNNLINKMGSKALNLFKLDNLNINVPEFLSFSSSFWNIILKENNIDLNEYLNNINNTDILDEESIKASIKEVQEKILSLKINENFKEVFYNIVNEKFENKNIFSVRSSSILEDTKNISFAGLFETYLNVEKEDLLEYALKSFALSFNLNAIKIAKMNSINLNKINTGFIIQEMIDSDLSGVIFTANPQGLLNETIIIIGRGTGDNVVEDKVPVTTYYYNRTDDTYYYEQMEDSPLLDEEHLKELLRISKEIEEDFESFQDIEFAIHDKKIYILQSRPVTTIKKENLKILDNSNIVESYPNITLPLTESYVKEAYFGVFKNLTEIVVGKSKIVDNNLDVLRNMVSSANGRMYYQISNWYSLIELLPFENKMIPIWQEMMGVQVKEISKTSMNLSHFQKIKTSLNIVRALKSSQKEMKKLEEDFIVVNEYFNKRFNEDLSNKELIELYRDVKEQLLNKWGITLINDIYAFIFTALIKNKFKKLDKIKYEEITNQYISGITNIESLKPIKEMINIADIVLENKDVKRKLKTLDNNEDVKVFLNEDGVFQEKVNKYIEIYGDRVLEELKIETETFRTDPIKLIKQILEFTEDSNRLKQLKESLKKESFENDEYMKNRSIKFLSKRVEMSINNREISRLNRTRIYGFVRSIFLQIGENLVKEGLILDKRDIFYLYKNEIIDIIENKNNDNNIKKNNISNSKYIDLINNRKNEYSKYNEIPMYTRLVLMKNEWNKNHKNINSRQFNNIDNEISGTPCSSGIVEGEVLIIDNPENIDDVKNKILVTKTTDPGWVFLLSMSSGIISEKGSLLSHTAIVSRELKIPSIVGVKNITNILKTGDYIKMDGNTGLITIIDNK